MSTSNQQTLAESGASDRPSILEKGTKKSARNHDPLALVAHLNVHSSQSHASPSFSHSPQLYYVTRPSSVIDYEEDYQGELQGDSQEDKLTTAMMLLARAITQHFSTPTNNQLCTSSNTRNQAVIQEGRVDIHSKNVSYVGNECSASSTKEQMLLAIKDEAGGNLNEEENEFMLDNAYGDDTLEELSAVVIIMARIQPADDNANVEPKYDAEVISEVNALQINLISGMLSKGVHEHMNPEKLETAINTSDDDQIDSNIIFNNPYVENNDGTYEHDSKAHD
ncbi:hypothetical protein Tco_0145489 [Tanacetum coccineum]